MGTTTGKQAWRVWAIVAILIFAGGCSSGTGTHVSDYPSGASYEYESHSDASPPAQADESDNERAAAIMNQLLYEEIEPKYRSAGLALSFSDWENLSDAVCIDLRAGGDGFYTIGDMSHIPESKQSELAQAAYILLALACDPSLSEVYFEPMSELHVRIAPDYSRRLAEAGIQIPAPAEGQFLPVPPADAPYPYPDNYSYTELEYTGGGNRVTCKDGSISYSGGRQGACSWHGGVAN